MWSADRMMVCARMFWERCEYWVLGIFILRLSPFFAYKVGSGYDELLMCRPTGGATKSIYFIKNKLKDYRIYITPLQ